MHRIDRDNSNISESWWEEFLALSLYYAAFNVLRSSSWNYWPYFYTTHQNDCAALSRRMKKYLSKPRTGNRTRAATKQSIIWWKCT
jgi:hypothetical protein